jgi:hypothetical protein
VPLALASGTQVVVAIYFLLNLLCLYVLPVGSLAAVKGSVLDVIADRLLAPRAGDVMGGVSIVSLAAGISALALHAFDGLRNRGTPNRRGYYRPQRPTFSSRSRTQNPSAAAAASASP